MSAAQTGRTHDLHPTASRKPKESLDPWAPSTHDPKLTLRWQNTARIFYPLIAFQIGAKLMSHGRYVVFHMAEVAIPR
jgi:hypothetical protein